MKTIYKRLTLAGVLLSVIVCARPALAQSQQDVDLSRKLEELNADRTLLDNASRVLEKINSSALVDELTLLQARAEQVKSPTDQVRELVQRPDKSLLVAGFSAVLLTGGMQPAPMPADIPESARKALADMKDFLPFKGYRLQDVAWLLGAGGTMRLRTENNASYILEILGPDRELGIGVKLSSGRDNPVLETKFQLANVGEGVVVGTSRVSGDEALILVLTAVPKAPQASLMNRR